MLTVEMVECSMSTRREETMSMPSVFGALFAATVGVRVASSQADRWAHQQLARFSPSYGTPGAQPFGS